MMCTACGVLRWLLGLQELIKCRNIASASSMLGDATLLLLARLVFAELVLPAVLILAGFVLATALILAGLVFAGLATVFVAGGALLLLFARALAAGA